MHGGDEESGMLDQSVDEVPRVSVVPLPALINNDDCPSHQCTPEPDETHNKQQDNRWCMSTFQRYAFCSLLLLFMLTLTLLSLSHSSGSIGREPPLLERKTTIREQHQHRNTAAPLSRSITQSTHPEPETTELLSPTTIELVTDKTDTAARRTEVSTIRKCTSSEASTSLPSEWDRLSRLNSTWCHYPTAFSSFQFDTERYHSEYLAAGSTCASLEAARLEALPANEKDSGLEFEVHVSNDGVLSVTGCTGGVLLYATKFDDNSDEAKGEWQAAVSTRKQLGTSPATLRLPYPTSFAFVWCDPTPDSIKAGIKPSGPKFVTVHTPVPREILAKRPKPTRKAAGSPKPVPRRNIVVLLLDAMSRMQFRILMPRTHAFLESLRAVKKSTSKQNSAELKPSHVAHRFTKFAVSGTNSYPSFMALFGNGDYSYYPGKNSSDWLWVAAQHAGYRTGFGEDNCAFNKYTIGGIQGRKESASPFMDFNGLLPACALPLFPSSGWMKQWHSRRCFQGRASWRYAWDALMMALEQQGSNLDHPLYYMLTLVEAHEAGGFMARHLDDDMFVEALQAMMALPAMRDNGMLFMYSDHGMHYGTYSTGSAWGSQEHLQPFLYVITPAPGAIGALQPQESQTLLANENHLTNPFDWYRTLKAQIVDEPEPEANRDAVFQSTKYDPYRLEIPTPLPPYNLLKDLISSQRSCEQMRIPLDQFWNSARSMSLEYCVCDSPYARVCHRPTDITQRLWQECTQLWGHPILFDAEFYARVHAGAIQSEWQKEADESINRDVVSLDGEESDSSASNSSDLVLASGTSSTFAATPCEALHHWCTIGLPRGLQSSPEFHLAALRHFHPRHTKNQQNPMSAAREYLVWGHAVTQPAPLRTLFTTTARKYASERLSSHCASSGYGMLEGAATWFRAIAGGSWCPTTTSDSSLQAERQPVAWSESATPLSDTEFDHLVNSAIHQCNHWCVFDIDHEKKIRGWEVTEPGCLLAFSEDPLPEHPRAQESVCLTLFATLRDDAIRQVEHEQAVHAITQ